MEILRIGFVKFKYQKGHPVKSVQVQPQGQGGQQAAQAQQFLSSKDSAGAAKGKDNYYSSNKGGNSYGGSGGGPSWQPDPHAYDQMATVCDALCNTAGMDAALLPVCACK